MGQSREPTRSKASRPAAAFGPGSVRWTLILAYGAAIALGLLFWRLVWQIVALLIWPP
jgi:hypothetical protein